MSYILTTNDDGYDAPGILALATAMREFGAVGVVAPARNQSASGHKKTLYTEIPYFHTQLADETPALAVDGVVVVEGAVPSADKIKSCLS